MQTLTTTKDVIKALGGTNAVRDLTGAKSDQLVSYWRTSGRFPAHLYLIMTDELRRQEKSAPPSLWRIAEPEAAE